jgi:hypothetical protein
MKGVSEKMDRITRRIGDIIEFVDGKGYANLSQEESIKILFKTLAECEDKLDKRDIMVKQLQGRCFAQTQGLICSFCGFKSNCSIACDHIANLGNIIKGVE